MRPLLLAIAGLLNFGLVALSGAASAHATIYSPDNNIKFVYGHMNEPVYTYQKTGLDLIISDNRTAAPITGLESFDHGVAVPPKVWVSYRYGEEGGPELNISEDFRAQFGKPGAYTTPIMFTKPGLYYVKLQGAINGTAYNMVLTPQHDVQPMTEIMWPDEQPLPDEQADEVSMLRQRLEALEAASRNTTPAGNAPGPDIAFILLVGLLALLIARRR